VWEEERQRKRGEVKGEIKERERKRYEGKELGERRGLDIKKSKRYLNNK
jgi:hypothetical protein